MMGIEAKITFTSLNDTIFPVKRVFTLNSQVSKITASRASKSSSKSLYSAGDNAWFDSPVMSRDHAEISLDPKGETLLLRDVGSLHGTSINNTPLVSYVPSVLHNGDVVVFGTEVKRGSETFPPCKFIVNYEISSPNRAGNTFAYPEYSDYDDDDDISLDESDLEQDQIMGTPIERNFQTIESLLDNNLLPNMETDFKNLSSISKNDKIENVVSETISLVGEKITEDPEDFTRCPEIIKVIPKTKELTTSSRTEDERQRSQTGDDRQSSQKPEHSTNLVAMPEAKEIKETRKLTIDKPIEESAYSEVSSQITEIETEGDKFDSENKKNDLSKSQINESQNIKCRKRKAEVISGNSEDEVESCAINSFPTRGKITSVLVEPSHKEIVSSTNLDAPPSKRQKIIESLGYVALGGFAAAAGLFSILVATAPEFS